MFTSLRGWRPPPPVRACAPPPNSAHAGPLRRFAPAAAGAARRTRLDNHASLSQPPIYIDTRNAQKVASILHFFKNFFVPRGDEDEIKEKADGGLPG